MITKLYGKSMNCFGFKKRDNAAELYCLRSDEIWLRIYGLWPYQSTYKKYICFSIFCTWNIFILTILSEGSIITTIEEIVIFSGLLVGITTGLCCLIIGITLFAQNNLLKKLSMQVENNYATITDPEEVAVMKKFAKRAKHRIFLFMGNVGITFVLFMLLNYLPIIYNDDEEYAKMFSYYSLRYIFNPKMQRLQVIIHIVLSIIYGGFFYLTFCSVYTHSIQNVCSIFEIVCYRLNKLPKIRVSLMNDNDIITELLNIVIKHQKAIEGARILDVIFGKFFYIFHVGSFTLCGMYIFGIQYGYNVGKVHLIVTIIISMTLWMHFAFMMSYGGEQIIEFSKQVHTAAYNNVHWHLMSLRSQKILLMLLIRSSQPCSLGARMATVSLDNITMTIKVAWSVAAVMMSRQ